MNRKDFFFTGASGVLNLAALALIPKTTRALSGSRTGEYPHPYRYLYTDVLNAYSLPEPEGMRVPFGWRSIVIPPAGSDEWPLLSWKQTMKTDKPGSLRISVALDVREEKVIEVLLANSGEVVGTFDIRYAPVNQIQAAWIESRHIPEVLKQGVRLRMIQGKTPLWIVAPSAELHKNAGAHPPHLMISGTTDPMEAFYDRLYSLDSIQQFGWMGGCVTDALWDLSQIRGHSNRARKTLVSHFDLFLKGGDLVREDYRSRIADNRISGVEVTLPFASMAMIYPEHPSIDLAVNNWLDLFDSGLSEPESMTITAEGSYTVAYPMLVIGKLRNNEKLLDLSIERLRIRRDYLRYNHALYLRRNPDDNRTFRNWARGIAWYMLGLTRSLLVLDPGDRPADLLRELEDVSAWAQEYQLESGLWRCFVDERGIRTDTSGSAGIAAALAIGARGGLLPSEAERAAQKTMRVLPEYLTDDGFLTGVAQSNRFGETLQRDDYRVIYQMGMGLMGQLAAALES